MTRALFQTNGLLWLVLVLRPVHSSSQTAPIPLLLITYIVPFSLLVMDTAGATKMSWSMLSEQVELVSSLLLVGQKISCFPKNAKPSSPLQVSPHSAYVPGHDDDPVDNGMYVYRIVLGFPESSSTSQLNTVAVPSHPSPHVKEQSSGTPSTYWSQLSAATTVPPSLVDTKSVASRPVHSIRVGDSKRTTAPLGRGCWTDSSNRARARSTLIILFVYYACTFLFVCLVNGTRADTETYAHLGNSHGIYVYVI